MKATSTFSAGWVMIVSAALGCQRAGVAPPTNPATSASHTPPSAPAAPPPLDAAQVAELDPSPFAVALRASGSIDLYAIEGGFAVLVVHPVGLTMSPGHVIDESQLRAAPTLLAGFLPAPENVTPAIAGMLDGHIVILGRWPQAATAVSEHMPQGGCLGCWDRWVWRRDHWEPVGGPEFEPDWWDASSMEPAPSRVALADGTTLWEKFTAPPDDLRYGTSTFYLDPHGVKKAARQRKSAPRVCKGGTRLEKKFSGVALPDGGLLSVGIDCAKGVASAEVWRGSERASTVSPLPQAPREIVAHSFYSDPVSYAVRSATDVAVSFTTTVDQQEQSYVAMFDGARFIPLPLPGRVVTAITRPADGSVLIRADEAAFRHPGLAEPSAAWSPICEGHPLGSNWVLVLDPAENAWIRGHDAVFEIEASGSCVAHPPPRSDLPSAPYAFTDLRFLSSGKPVAVATRDLPDGPEAVLLVARR